MVPSPSSLMSKTYYSMLYIVIYIYKTEVVGKALWLYTYQGCNRSTSNTMPGGIMHPITAGLCHWLTSYCSTRVKKAFRNGVAYSSMSLNESLTR